MHGSNKAEDRRGADANGAGEKRARVVKLNDQARNRLGLHLRAMYSEIINQPVPDRFTDLISRLDQAPHEASEPV